MADVFQAGLQPGRRQRAAVGARRRVAADSARHPAGGAAHRAVAIGDCGGGRGVRSGVARLGHAVVADARGDDAGDGVRPVADQLDRAERGLLLQPVGGERRLRRDPPHRWRGRPAIGASRSSSSPSASARSSRASPGFGAPVAITASMLAGLGFAPIMAATLALIANTTPVAFGSLGIPITTLGGLLAPMLGRDVQTTTRALSAMAGRQLALFSLIIPAYLVVLFAGWKRMVEVWPAVRDGRRQLCARPVRRVELRGTGADGLAVGVVFADVGRCCCSRCGARARSSSSTRSRCEVAAPARCAGARGPRVRHLRNPDRRRAGGTDRQLRRVCRSWSRRSISRRCSDADRSATGFARSRGSGRARPPTPQGLRFPGLGVQLARRLSARGRPPGGARAARAAGGRDASSPYPLTYRLDFLATAGTLVLIAAFVAFIPMWLAGLPIGALGTTFAQNDQTAAVADRDDRVHSVDRHGDELLGHDLVDGARARDGRASSFRSSRPGSG